MRWNSIKWESWFFMKNKLILFDPYCTFYPANFPKAHWFTWSNFKADKAHFLKHLDKAMNLECDFFHFQRLSFDFSFVSIILSSTLSYHSLILFAIYFFQAPTHNFPSPFYLNTSFLQSPAMKDHICRSKIFIPGSSNHLYGFNYRIKR